MTASSAFRLIRHDRVIKAASRHTATAAVGWIVAGGRGEGEERKKRLISNQGSRNDTELNLQQDDEASQSTTSRNHLVSLMKSHLHLQTVQQKPLESIHTLILQVLSV